MRHKLNSVTGDIVLLLCHKDCWIELLEISVCASSTEPRASAKIFKRRYKSNFRQIKKKRWVEASEKSSEEKSRVGKRREERRREEKRRERVRRLRLRVTTTKTSRTLRTEIRSQTSDNMDRWKSRGGKRQRGQEKEVRRSERRKSEKKEDAGARKGRKVGEHSVFPMFCSSRRSKK